jgi:hypothetical protein
MSYVPWSGVCGKKGLRDPLVHVELKRGSVVKISLGNTVQEDWDSMFLRNTAHIAVSSKKKTLTVGSFLGCDAALIGGYKRFGAKYQFPLQGDGGDRKLR